MYFAGTHMIAMEDSYHYLTKGDCEWLLDCGRREQARLLKKLEDNDLANVKLINQMNAIEAQQKRLKIRLVEIERN